MGEPDNRYAVVHIDKMMKLFLTLIFGLLSWGTAAADPGLEPVLQSMSRHERPVSDLRITYEAGNPHDGRGKDKLEILGNGNLTVEHFEGNQSTVLSDMLTDETALMIVNEMLESKFWLAQRPRKPSDPRSFDETEVTIRVSTVQKDADFSLTVPQVEATLNPHLINLVKVFEILIRETSSATRS